MHSQDVAQVATAVKASIANTCITALIGTCVAMLVSFPVTPLVVQDSEDMRRYAELLPHEVSTINAEHAEARTRLEALRLQVMKYIKTECTVVHVSMSVEYTTTT